LNNTGQEEKVRKSNVRGLDWLRHNIFTGKITTAKFPLNRNKHLTMKNRNLK
jgi:hypothetical protein